MAQKQNKGMNMLQCADHDMILDAHGNCPVCDLLEELESLRQENSRLRAEVENLLVVNRTANEHIGHEADEHDKLVASLNAELKRLREALATWLKWWDHEVSGTEKGRIYRWTEELLNPPKNR